MAEPLRLNDAFRLTAKHLSRAGVDFAVIGGLAVAARSEPRFTRDIDFAVLAKNDPEAEKLVNFLLRSGYELKAALERTGLSRLSTVRLFRSEEPRILVDLLFSSSGIEPEVVLGATPLEILGEIVKVATVGHLIAMKLFSHDDVRRPQDRVDLAQLLLVTREEDLAVASEALSLIEDRGFHQGRDLKTEFRALIDLHYERDIEPTL